MAAITPDRLHAMLDEVRVGQRRRIDYVSGRGHIQLLRREQGAGGRGSTALVAGRGGAEIPITYDRVFGIVSALEPDVPVHLDSFLKNNGNDRTVVSAILLQTREFCYVRERGGRTKIVWSPGQAHAPDEPSVWCPERPAVPDQFSRAAVMAAVDRVTRDGIYCRERVCDVAVGIGFRHAAISGPPGSGKNNMVRLFGEALGVNFVEVSATREWTAYSLMGHLTLAGGNTEFVPGPFLRAVDRCAAAPDGKPVWLLIDECNRCDTDAVFGQLLTLLGRDSGTEGSEFTPDGDPLGRRHVIPPNFRIIMCFNECDGESVNGGLSSALRRRMNIYRIDLPPNEDGGLSSLREWEFARAKALKYARLTGDDAEAAASALAGEEEAIRATVGGVRAQFKALGTGQMITWCADYCRRVHLFPSEDRRRHLDRAAEATVIGTLESDSVRRHFNGTGRTPDTDAVADAMRMHGLAISAARVTALAAAFSTTL